MEANALMRYWRQTANNEREAERNVERLEGKLAAIMGILFRLIKERESRFGRRRERERERGRKLRSKLCRETARSCSRCETDEDSGNCW